MKKVKIPMTATRALRLSKIGKNNSKAIAFLLAEGLKNLTGEAKSFSCKV